jgi:branched-subunit amino acid ABC-type transport system permease component
VSDWALFGLLGIAAGAVYAAIAVGVILVHRGSGVVNLAQGAMAMFPAVVFVRLRADGELVLPVVGIPGRVDLGGPWPVVPAFAAAVLIGVAIGAVAYLVVFRRLADAPPVTRLVASVGLTIVLQGAAVAQVGTVTRRAEAVLPDDVVDVFGPVPADRFWLAGLVVVMALAIAALYRYTLFGLATRGAAEDAKGALLLGYSPVVLGLLNWVLAAALAAVVGVLISPISGVNPFNYSLFVVPALAAALAGRLRSIVTALVVGLVLGMFEGVAVHLVARREVPDFLLAGFDAVVPFAAIIAVLVFAGRTVPGRGTLLERRHPNAPLPTTRSIRTLGALGAALLLMTVGDASLRLAAITSMMVTILCLSIVVLTGYVGQVSLAQLTLAGFSAFMLSRWSDKWGVPFPLAPLLAIATTTALGVLVSLPALRIRGIQFSVVTLAAAVAIEQLLFRSPVFTGTGGIAHVDPPSLFGFDFGIIGDGEYPDRPFGWFVLALTVGCFALVANVRRSPLGRRLLAVRANERAAAAAGVDVARAKLTAAAIAAFLAAVSGTVFAYKNVDFGWPGLEASRGLQLLAIAYLGGVGALGGAGVAGLLAPSGLVLVLLGSPAASGTQLLLSGIGLLVVTVKFPGGLASAGPWLRSLATSGRPRPRRQAAHRLPHRHDDADRVDVEVYQLGDDDPERLRR